MNRIIIAYLLFIGVGVAWVSLVYVVMVTIDWDKVWNFFRRKK